MPLEIASADTLGLCSVLAVFCCVSIVASSLSTPPRTRGPESESRDDVKVNGSEDMAIPILRGLDVEEPIEVSVPTSIWAVILSLRACRPA